MRTEKLLVKRAAGDGRGDHPAKKLRAFANNLPSRGDRIRTCDLLVPNQTRYQPAPRPVFLCALAIL